ncbi:hypothetical protein KY320_01500 [Candidatus Woesearchaeota archaeon]|nr:hypothetical protein [Candidatus Woesearchaeota archaeon]
MIEKLMELPLLQILLGGVFVILGLKIVREIIIPILMAVVVGIITYFSLIKLGVI